MLTVLVSDIWGGAAAADCTRRLICESEMGLTDLMQLRWEGRLEVGGAGLFDVGIIIHVSGVICGGDIAKTALLSGGNAGWRLVSGEPAYKGPEVMGL